MPDYLEQTQRPIPNGPISVFGHYGLFTVDAFERSERRFDDISQAEVSFAQHDVMQMYGRQYQNYNPDQTPDEVRIGKVLHYLAQLRHIPGIRSVAGNPQRKGRRV